MKDLTEIFDSNRKKILGNIGKYKTENNDDSNPQEKIKTKYVLNKVSYCKNRFFHQKKLLSQIFLQLFSVFLQKSSIYP